jgi:hypothetical protein
MILLRADHTVAPRARPERPREPMLAAADHGWMVGSSAVLKRLLLLVPAATCGVGALRPKTRFHRAFPRVRPAHVTSLPSVCFQYDLTKGRKLI